MKKGKIKFIQENGEWSNSSGTFNKFKVQFDDGQTYQFLAKGQFKKQIGDLVDYEVTNEQYGTAKLIYTQPQANGQSKDQLIIRQSMVKAAVDFNRGNAISDIQTVLADAQTLIDFVNK
tara:strand:+ start:1814 stop:2170 length:357 start_codon:yes stop_codon:yes gene_type:complete